MKPYESPLTGSGFDNRFHPIHGNFAEAAELAGNAAPSTQFFSTSECPISRLRKGTGDFFSGGRTSRHEDEQEIRPDG